MCASEKSGKLMRVLITTLWPTLEQTAAAYGLPIERVRRIGNLAVDVIARDATGADHAVGRYDGQRGH